MKVDGKVWVVTGAGAGMGRELVLLLLQRGARVAAVDLSAERLQETAALASAPERLSTHVLDITDRAGVDALPAAVVEVHGVVDGLINNAGIIQPFVPVVDMDDGTIDRVMGVNFHATLQLCRVFLPVLLVRPEAHLANVSSMGGFFPFPGQTVYGASKAAVKLLTEGLYAELLDSDVTVSVIMPGAVSTAITSNSGVAEPEVAEGSVRMTSPAKAAQVILDGLEKDRLHIYVGADAKVMSLAIKLIPRTAIKFVQKQMAKHTSPQGATQS
jgi:short-subunit dehydrogenase